MGIKAGSHNTIAIKIEFSGGQAPQRHARISLHDDSIHRVINPSNGGLATFHGVPAGATSAVVTVDGVITARKSIVIPAAGRSDETVVADGQPIASDTRVLGIYGAGPTGTGYSNADVKAIIDDVGGEMFDGPGQISFWTPWIINVLNVIKKHYKADGDAIKPARLVLLGYSMGGKGAVDLACMLARHKTLKRIKVVLVGIDPVQLFGSQPLELPDNVVAWLNYYQQDASGQGIVGTVPAVGPGWPFSIPVDVDMTRISGGPLAAGAGTGSGANHLLTTKDEGTTVDHVTIPSVVHSRVVAFIRANR